LKLIIQIPCYNEEETLPITIKCLPERLDGIKKIEYLVIDDGSSDNTVRVAKNSGVHHIIKLPRHYGLAYAYMKGLETCLNNKADIIVNLDADNQYNADDIPKLIKPIFDRKADMVIGCRPISRIRSFSFLKKKLEILGSWTIKILSGADIKDAPSGFRAISRETALRLNVFSKYTYTLETIIQASQIGLKIVSVPVRVNKEMRSSRLVKNIVSYIYRSIITIIRIFVTYKPFRFFISIGSIFFLGGLSLGIRFLYFIFKGTATGHVQSLILTAILLIISFLFLILGFIGELISINRRLLEDIQFKIRSNEFKQK
jgi:glycosyltransferase involved in cell wall biosynthesis